MSVLLSELVALENRAVALLGSLATDVTRSTPGVISSQNGWTGIDITMLESRSEGNPAADVKVTIETTLRIGVVATVGGLDLARWINATAMNILIGDPEVRAGIFADVEGTESKPFPADFGGTPAIELVTVIRSTVHDSEPYGQALGFNLATDAQSSAEAEGGDDDTGHVVLTDSGHRITWQARNSVLVGPVTPLVLYAGASAGDTITVLDAADAVVDTFAVVTIPTGIQAVPNQLNSGTYRVEIEGVRADLALSVTERVVTS